jgi:hypothetical protein
MHQHEHCSKVGEAEAQISVSCRRSGSLGSRGEGRCFCRKRAERWGGMYTGMPGNACRTQEAEAQGSVDRSCISQQRGRAVIDVAACLPSARRQQHELLLAMVHAAVVSNGRVDPWGVHPSLFKCLGFRFVCAAGLSPALAEHQMKSCSGFMSKDTIFWLKAVDSCFSWASPRAPGAAALCSDLVYESQAGWTEISFL